MHKIYFRADASGNIGYGHFVRTLALADMLKEDFDCTIFTQTASEFQKAEAASVCRMVELPSDESSFGLFLEMLSGNETVVLDNYFFSAGYQKAIKEKGCRLVCIDDLHDRHFYADLIINHCSSDCSGYECEEYTRFCLGPRWALLRRPFLNAGTNSGNTRNWLITFGGTDRYGLTSLYKSVLEQSGLADRIETVDASRRLNASQMASLMGECGNVICSASSVCYEALACGCKVYAGYYVDNQKDLYDSLVEKNLITPLGNLLEKDAALPEGAEECGGLAFTDCAANYRLVFRALTLQAVNYTDMTPAQSFKTWECRNREDIRRWMTNPEPFSFESHCSFVEKLKKDSTKLYYSFFDGEEFLGSYDFTDIVDGETSGRGLYVNPEYQGRHIASMMEKYLECEIVRRGVKTLTAEVFRNNGKSIAFHLRAGYIKVGEDERFIYFKKEI